MSLGYDNVIGLTGLFAMVRFSSTQVLLVATMWDIEHARLWVNRVQNRHAMRCRTVHMHRVDGRLIEVAAEV